MNKFFRALSSNGNCELIYLRPFYNLDRDNIHYVNNYDEEKIEVNVFALYEENKELKKHLEVPEHCNLKTLEDYKSYYEDTTKEQIIEDTYIDYCAYVNLAHRYSELKKQLEEKQNPLRGIFEQVSDDTLLRDCGNMNAEIKELKNQQKEFIEYLEYQVKLQEELNDKLLATGFEEILSKYKSVIGVSDE